MDSAECKDSADNGVFRPLWTGITNAAESHRQAFVFTRRPAIRPHPGRQGLRQEAFQER